MGPVVKFPVSVLKRNPFGIWKDTDVCTGSLRNENNVRSGSGNRDRLNTFSGHLVNAWEHSNRVRFVETF